MLPQPSFKTISGFGGSSAKAPKIFLSIENMLLQLPFETINRFGRSGLKASTIFPLIENTLLQHSFMTISGFQGSKSKDPMVQFWSRTHCLSHHSRPLVDLADQAQVPWRFHLDQEHVVSAHVQVHQQILHIKPKGSNNLPHQPRTQCFKTHLWSSADPTNQARRPRRPSLSIENKLFKPSFMTSSGFNGSNPNTLVTP